MYPHSSRYNKCNKCNKCNKYNKYNKHGFGISVEHCFTLFVITWAWAQLAVLYVASLACLSDDKYYEFARLKKKIITYVATGWVRIH